MVNEKLVIESGLMFSNAVNMLEMLWSDLLSFTLFDDRQKESVSEQTQNKRFLLSTL